MNKTNLVLSPGSKEVSFDEESNTLTVPPSLEIMCNHMLLKGESGRDIMSFIRQADKINLDKNYLMYGKQIDPIVGVKLDPIGFISFLDNDLRTELHILETEKYNWAILLAPEGGKLGEIRLLPLTNGTCTIICKCADMFDLTPESHLAAREYWAQPDAELINLPHQWNSYDHAYMMRRRLIEDLRKAGALAD